MSKALAFLLALLLPAAALADTPPDSGPLADNSHTCSEDYPEAALLARVEGKTTVKFTIRKDGSVLDPSVSQSSGNADLDAATLSCVKRWHYKPAMRQGAAVDTPWEAVVQWKLHEPSIAWLTMRCAPRHPLTADMLARTDSRTMFSFRVMPDSSVRDVRVLHTSGNDDLDQAGVKCLAREHYDAGSLDIPPDGLPGRVELNWRMQLEHDTPIAAPFPLEMVYPLPMRKNECRGPASAGGSARPTVLEFTIGNDGAVRDVKLKTSSGNDALDRVALGCAGGWSFRPATMHDEPIAVTWTATIPWTDRTL